MIDIKITKEIDGNETITNAGWRDITIGSSATILAAWLIPMALVYYAVALVACATIFSEPTVGGVTADPWGVIIVLFACAGVVRVCDWLSGRIGALILTAINFEPKLK